VFGLRWTDDRVVAMTWERVLHLGVIPIPVLFYHYVLVFLDLPRRTRTLVIGYALASFFAAVSPTPWFMPGVIETFWGFMPKSGPLYAPFVVYFYAFLGLGLMQLVRSYRMMRSSFRRNRTRLVIIGTCFAITGGVIDFLRFIVGWKWLYPTGIPANAVFAVALGIAVVRYRLWDVRIMAKRAVLYTLMSLGLVPVVIGSLYLPDRFTPGDDFTPHLPFAFALLAVVVVTLPFLRRLETSAERFMFARQHGVRDALGALSKDMASILDLQRLGQRLTEGLVQRVPVLHASLHLRDETTTRERFHSFSRAMSPALEAAFTEPALDSRLILWLRLTGKPIAIEEVAFQAIQDPTMRTLAADLEAWRVALLIPLFMDGELTAVLAIGEKVSGEIFIP
jgi:hypothetical protein